MARYSNKIKNELIKAEIEKLVEIFIDLPEHKKKLANGLIEQAAFLRVSISDLQNDINLHGYSTKSPQGVKKRPEADLHISMSKNYQSVIKQLSDISDKNIIEAIDTDEMESQKNFEKFLKDGEHE